MGSISEAGISPFLSLSRGGPMDSRNQPLHVVFLPYMAPGHMMPMIDMARLFAANGVKVSIITTTANGTRFKNAIDRDIKLGRQIALEILPFPSAEAGLPEGCENLSSTPTKEMSIKLFNAIKLLQPKIESVIRTLCPNCIASDVLFPWTVTVATELGIPRLAFSGSGFFNLCVSYCIEHYQPHKNIVSETETFVVPTLPDVVKLTRSQLPDLVKEKTDFSELFETLKEAERKSFGTLVNSVYELESAYAEYYRKEIGIRAWHLGPVSFFNKEENDKIDRGDKAAVCKHKCLSWLDSNKPNSVLYICFGSLVQFSKRQLTEIASALDDTGHNFIWVVGKVLKTAEEDDKEDQHQEWWLPKDYEEGMYNSGRGLVIRGWAPQLLILEHPAIGGFLTHCGWNSMLEGVSTGVPMITWPVFAEQFYNEKLVTQVLHTGVPVGNENWKIWAMQETELISRDKIKNAVSMVMGEGEEAEEMRKRSHRYGELAKSAVEEGGSSYNDMKDIIEKIKSYGPQNLV